MLLLRYSNGIGVLFLCFRHDYRFHACVLRGRFDDNIAEKDMVKATMLLKTGEEEFWTKQHPSPYIFPDSPGGTSYERYECYRVRHAPRTSCSIIYLTLLRKCVYSSRVIAYIGTGLFIII